MIQAITILLCAALFAWGGYSFNKARRFIMPVVLACACWYLTGSIWSLTMLTSAGFLCMGYGEDAPLVHVFSGCWGRGVWGFLVALSLSLGLFLTGHLAWYWFACYLVIGFSFEPMFKNLPQVIGDCLIGAGFGSIVFMIHSLTRYSG